MTVANRTALAFSEVIGRLNVTYRQNKNQAMLNAMMKISSMEASARQ
jgi:hypothetical protein